MTTCAVEQADDWNTRSFSGGYGGLRDLAADGFSGIVTAGPARLCMTKGTVVGVLDGAIEDFEDASGTAAEAPTPALPLLVAMQGRDGEVQGQYYTEDTPLSEVDRTLTEGNFTGYVELAENVLSGDYYQVYHQGRSMSVAFVGASGQLFTEDEAFGKADDEVGIYEVRQVDIETIEIPEPAGGVAAGAGADDANDESDGVTESDTTAGTGGVSGPESDAATDADVADATPDSPEDDELASADAAATSDPEAAGATAGPGAEETGEGRGGEYEAESRADTENRTREGGDPSRTSGSDAGGVDTERTGADVEEPTASPGGRGERQHAAGARDVETADAGTRDRQSTEQRTRTGPSADDSGGADRATGRQSPRRAADTGGSATDLETRSVPSLDPDRTSEGETEASAPAGAAAVQPQPQPQGQSQSDPEPQSERQAPRQGGDEGNGATEQAGARRDRRGSRQTGRSDSTSGADDGEHLAAELEEREAEVERLESELAATTEEREDLEEKLNAVRQERDELRARVEELERRVEELRAESGATSVADRSRLSPEEAIDGTNLFVRYASKGDPTLQTAHGGRAEATAVNENLEIQHHTQFEAEDVAVNGEPFEDYLTETIQYQFVEWVVRTLPYEIRDTGHEGALKDLYDALPDVDRAELNGAVTVQFREDGDQHRSQEQFDIVLRDRMGNPLAVANINDSRDPASRDMMESLITASQRVGESKASLAGGFLVTSSFFQPEAMEAAADATGGGLLSRDKRESFVKLSRKEGFHLCLVEARGEKFNLSVPEI